MRREDLDAAAWGALFALLRAVTFSATVIADLVRWLLWR